jgi:hypothetical protein
VSPDDPRHGTTAGHVAGCRCQPCHTAKMRYDKCRRWEAQQGLARKVPSLGTVRRIQALRALGWSTRIIAREAEMHHSALARIGDYPTVYRATTHTIALVYERLSMALPPQTNQAEKHAVTKTRRTARRHGWPPPLAWDDIDRDPEPVATETEHDVDDVVVDRIVAGENLPANNRERFAVVARYLELGLPLRDLASRLGWKPERYLPVDQESVA